LVILYEEFPQKLLEEARPAAIIAGGIIAPVYFLWIANIMHRPYKTTHHSSDEVEKARELALMRRRGIVKPVTWLDVSSAFQQHYRIVKNALINAVGGYDNIEHIREYPADPFEAYYKIAVTLKNPITAELKLIDEDYLEFNGQRMPLYIDEKAYTPYRLRLFRYFAADMKNYKRKFKKRK
jgi:hypothetical protein